MSNTASNVRFYEAREEEVEEIRDGRHEKNTKRSTSFGVNVFREWLVAREMAPEFEVLTPAALNTSLAKFYVEARKEDGSVYSKSSLNVIRAAIQRHLQSAPWNWTSSIIHNPVFSTSNEVLVGVFKKMTAEGMARPRPHYPIDPGDLQKLFETGVMGKDTPNALLNLVWFLLCLHFGKRGAEGWREMKKDTFHVGRDDEGRHFISYSAAEKQKNHQGNFKIHLLKYCIKLKIYGLKIIITTLIYYL